MDLKKVYLLAQSETLPNDDSLSQVLQANGFSVESVGTVDDLVTALEDNADSEMVVVAHKPSISSEAGAVAGYNDFLRRFAQARAARDQRPTWLVVVREERQVADEPFVAYHGVVSAYLTLPIDQELLSECVERLTADG